jgi:DNA-binding NarL/FixJ family response regulator
MAKHKILIADDHAMIRDGVKTLLKQNKECSVVGEAVNGAEAITKYKSLKPDLAILDISMPEMNGMEAAREIIKLHPEARIIILSMYDDEDYISQCIEYGVKGFVVKSESGNELNYAIKSVLEGRSYFSHHVQEVIVKKYTSGVKRKPKEPEIKLTNREIEIIKLISDGLTSHQIADKLFISPRTVETHRANLMKKVGVKNSIELVKKVEKLGVM